MSQDYSHLKIKSYDLWDLFLHEKQFPYIGRCYAWAIRDGAVKVTDMNAPERGELFSKIIPAWNNAVAELFKHDWPNVAILGNEAPHLHAHLIPRYRSPRNFYGIEFIDPNPKGNYSPYPKKKIDLEILLQIKEEMQAQL